MENLTITARLLCLALLMLLAAPALAAEAEAAAQIKLTPFVSGSTHPVHLAFAPGSDGTLYVVEEGGLIVAFDNGVKRSEPFLDLTPYEGLEGMQDEPESVQLLSLAFHPSYAENGKAFVTFVRKKGKSYRFHLGEFLLNRDSNRLNRETERILLNVDQRGEHFGGGLTFDKKGMLLVGIADGGGSHDPKNRAQSLSDLAGTVLRLNIDEGDPYLPPLDNPFVMNDMGLREIFAFGLRDPWKVTVDRQTGYIWAGDRGEDTYEEINLIEPGKNYGWSVYEGKLCLRMRFECQNDSMTTPVLMYTRQYGKAVTGGYVYRGAKVPKLSGKYLYGDFHSGRLWAMSLNDKTPVSFEELLLTKHQISSFGEDSQGELYLADYRSGTVYRIDPGSGAKQASAPPSASEAAPAAQLGSSPAAAQPAKKPIRINK